MADNQVGSGTGGKCPECGSYEVWVAMSKPPSYFCRKCGHQFTKAEPGEKKE